MSEKIVAGIEVLINKEIEKGITEKLNASCSKYYGKNKEIQNMISEKNFADTISRVTVTSNDGKVLMHIDPKDLNLVDEEYRVRFGEVCSEYFSEIASEYFNHDNNTENIEEKNLKDDMIEVLKNKMCVSEEMLEYPVNIIVENLKGIMSTEDKEAKLIKDILKNNLKDVRPRNAIEIIGARWLVLDKKEKAAIASCLGNIRYSNYVIEFFDGITTQN